MTMEETTMADESTTPARTTEAAPAPAMPLGKLATQLRSREKKLSAQASALERERSEHEAQIRGEAARLHGAQPVMARAHEVLARAKTDPIGLLRGIGLDDDGISKLLTRPPRRGSSVDQELAAVRQELASSRTEKQRAAAEAFAEKQNAAFVAAARAAEKYPLSAQLSDERLRSKGLEIARAGFGRGEHLSDAQILAQLEADLREVHATAATAVKGRGTQPTHRADFDGDVLGLSEEDLARVTQASIAAVREEARAKDAGDIEVPPDPLYLEQNDPEAFYALTRSAIESDKKRLQKGQDGRFKRIT